MAGHSGVAVDFINRREGNSSDRFRVVALFYLTDWPRQARWLPEDERDWIAGELEAESKAKKKIHEYTIWEAFSDRQVILLILA